MQLGSRKSAVSSLNATTFSGKSGAESRGGMIDGLMAGCIIKSRECGGQGVWWVATRNGSVTEFSLRGGLTGKDLERIS